MLSKNETNNTRGDLLTASSTDVVQSTSQLTSANPRPCHIVCNTPDKQLYSVASAICRYLYRYSCFVLFCCAHPANRIYTVTYLYSRGWDRRGASHGSCKGLPAKRSRAPSSLSRGRGGLLLYWESSAVRRRLAYSHARLGANKSSGG